MHDDITVRKFWSKVDKRGPDECWPWTGAKSPRGYGRFSVNSKYRVATQISWEIENGAPFPIERMACHSCDNPPCVNPKHLWPGTNKENMQDASKKGRLLFRTHCPRGHELNDSTVWVRIDRGHRHRICKECSRITKNKSRAKMRALKIQEIENGK